MTRDFDHSAGEDILESVLRGDSCDSASPEEVESLRGFILSCREAAGAHEESSALADRALAASTREDLSWHGDVRVVGRYVRDGLRSSALLRLAAASLLLHLAAIPVVALFMLTEEPELPEFRVEVGRESSPFAELEPEAKDPDLDIATAAGVDTLLVENSLSWSRWWVSVSEDPLEGASAAPPDWLQARASTLWGARGPGGPSWNAAELDPLMALELRLDEYLVGPRGAQFDVDDQDAIDIVAGMVKRQADDRSWLAVSALARAESYGLNSEEGALALATARAEYPRNNPLRPLIEVDGDVRARTPLDPLWMEALRANDPASLPEAWFRRLQLIEANRAR